MKNRSKRRIGFGLVAALCLSALTGCGSSSKKETSKTEEGYYGDTTTISFTTWIGYAPMFIADEKGIFEKNGVDVDIQVIESAADIKTALAANSIQGAAQTVDTQVMGTGSGIETTQVLAMDTSDGGDGIVCKNEYKSLDDLVGKKVALNTSGGASLFYFNYLIAEAGYKMDDFDIQNMSSGDAGSAFVGGKVDAAVTWEPWLTNAKKTDFGTVLYDSSTAPGVICDTLGFSTEFVEKYPKTVQAICDSWFDALDMLDAEETHEECMNIMADKLGMTMEELEASINTVTYYDRDKNKSYVGGGELQKMSEYAASVWYDIGLVDHEIDCSNVVNTEFVASK